MTTQLEMWKRRAEKIEKSSKEEFKRKKANIENLKKISIMFGACAKLWKLQARKLEKELK